MEAAKGPSNVSITLAELKPRSASSQAHVLRTPMLPAPRLSALTGAEVHVKYENLQVTNSFKSVGREPSLRR